MIKAASCNFYRELTQQLFYSVAEIFPAEEKVLVHYVKDNPDFCLKSLSKAELELEFGEKILKNDEKSIDFDFFSDILKQNIPKNIGLSVQTRPDILEYFILSLYPADDKKKLYATLNKAKCSSESITFVSKKSPVSYRLSDILYISYGNHCVEIHTENNTQKLFYIGFSDAADILLTHNNFLRSYKNCVLNMDKVQKIEDDAFVMNNSDIISIPKRRLKEIKNSYNKYMLLKDELI